MLVDKYQNTLNTGPELWHAALEVLRHDYGDSTFRSWFSQLAFAENKGNVLILTVPSRFIKDWIDYNYSNAIAETILSLNPVINKIEIKIKPLRAFVTDASEIKTAVVANDDVKSAEDKCDIMDFELDSRFTFENFVEGQSNKLALNAAKSLCNGQKLPSDSNILYIQSPVGMGKTHLLQAIVTELRIKSPELKVAYLSADKFMHLYISAIRKNDLISLQSKMRSLDILLIDDLQFICGKNATQQELGQTFSQLAESNRRVVVSCDTNPYNLNLDMRTKSRLAGGLCVKITPADFDLRLAVLVNKAKMLNVVMGEDVLKFLASKICSSIRELEGAFSKLVYFASIDGKVIDLAFAEEILKENFAANEKSISVDQIIDLVADYHNLTPVEIRSKSRAARYSIPRQIAAYLSKQMTTKSLQEIGFRLGGKDHATVIYSVKKLEAKLEGSKAFAEELAKIIEYIGDRSLLVA